MKADNTPSQLHLFIKPVREYLIHGPIEPSGLAYVEVVKPYLDYVGSALSVHFMLESVVVDRVPKWWKGTVAEFEQEFNDELQIRISRLNQDVIWMAAERLVYAGYLQPLPEDATDEQVEDFFVRVKKHLEQRRALELLLDMWMEAIGVV